MAESARVCPKCAVAYEPDVIFCPRDGAPLGGRKTAIVDDPFLDRTIAGQFQIRQIVGIGAMGRVYRAHQLGIERDVAVKVLHRELLRNAKVLTRFHREAKVASRLSHPNVVQVLMTGVLEPSDGNGVGEAYLVMEYLDGVSLRSALAAAGGALALPRALHVILQVCDAVGEAHSQGIVHRDLKPENVMLVRRGHDEDFVKVLDFGVARLDWADTVATEAGSIFGTARYISPEGAKGERVGAAGDVYSIATLLFQCLSGQTPFNAESPVAILVQHTTEPPPDVRSIARSSYVPESIARVIHANLAKDPAKRCPSARHLAKTLIEAAREAGLSGEELIHRSTLLGGAQGALGLASMQRTKTLHLSPELSEKLSGNGGGQRGTAGVELRTALVEPQPLAPKAVDPAPLEPAPVEPAFVTGPVLHSESAVDPTVDTEFDGAARSRPPESVARRASLPTPEPRSNATDGRRSVREARASVEPTLADEPAPSQGSPASFHEPRASFHESATMTHAPAQTSVYRLKQTLIIAVCFVFGAALSVGTARYLGAFEDGEPTLQSYEQRARTAFEQQHWDRPKDRNFRDITAAALERWPNAPKIVALRTRAAQKLLDEARGLTAQEPKRARVLIQLAREFDPKNPALPELAESIATAASTPTARPSARAPTSASAATPSAISPPSSPNIKQAASKPAKEKQTAKSSTKAPPKPPADAPVKAPTKSSTHATEASEAPSALPSNEEPRTKPSTTGGRWL